MWIYNPYMSERIIKSIDYEGLWRSRHFWSSKKSHAETEIWAMSYGINRLDQRCRYFLFSLKWMNNLCPDRFLVCVTSNSFFDLQVYGTFQQNETSIKILIIDFFRGWPDLYPSFIECTSSPMTSSFANSDENIFD